MLRNLALIVDQHPVVAGLDVVVVMLRPRQFIPALAPARAAATPAPPPAAPATPPIAVSTPTRPQSTDPFWCCCAPADNPPDINAPPIVAAPIGPPTPVAITATPPTTSAPAAMYSQLSFTQCVPADATFRNDPLSESRYPCSSASVTGRNPHGSTAFRGSFPAKLYGFPAQPAPRNRGSPSPPAPERPFLTRL